MICSNALRDSLYVLLFWVRLFPFCKVLYFMEFVIVSLKKFDFEVMNAPMA
jgi:hypothetical protein